MRILIAGNMGYVGSVLSRHLRKKFPKIELIGYDSGLFAHCLTAAANLPETMLDWQHFGDVRDLPAALLAGCDAVICLAAISNDPMGTRFEAATDAINFGATARLAELAKQAGVRNFVFASSCSIYGFAEGDARREDDAVNPLTAYARSKVAVEQALAQMDRGGMTVTALRFATACGMSDRLRLDLVLNDFAACAIASGQITVLSDGTPWRPLIDVRDMARALEWGAMRPARNPDDFLIVNAGSDQWNFRVKDLADAVATALPGTRVSINEAAPPDKRSYKVDFSRFRELAPEHQPLLTLAESISAICDGLRAMNFSDTKFRESSLIRLKVLDGHLAAGRLDSALRWQGRAAI